MINPRLKAYPAPVPTGEAVSTGTSHWYMLQMVGNDKRVLEFGCASGYMSARLKEAGCHVTGIDVDVDAIAAAREICDELIVADLDVRPLAEIVPDVAYDALIFGDVLEHLRDPWRVLDDARRFIAPGGFAVLSIPNVAHGSVRLKLLQGEFDYSELGILDDTHLRFFTLKTVEELCLRAGFRIDTLERTKVGFFQETPLTPVSREMMFDPELIEQIRRDPEHDTLQFILRVTPLDDTEKFDVLAKELSSVRDRLRTAETSARLSQEAYDEVEAELEQRDRSGRAASSGDVALHNVSAVDETDPRRSQGARRGKTISARAVKRAERFAAANDRAQAELAAAHEHAAREIAAVNERAARDLAAAEARAVSDRAAAAALAVIELTRFAESERSRAELATANEALLVKYRKAHDENERLGSSLRAAQEKYVDAKQAHARCADTDAEHAKFRDAMSAAVRRFIRYAEGELASVQARVVEMDAAIAAVQHSKIWSLKRALGKLRR